MNYPSCPSPTLSPSTNDPQSSLAVLHKKWFLLQCYTVHIPSYDSVVCYLDISVHEVPTVNVLNSGRHLEGDTKYSNVDTDWFEIAKDFQFFEFNALNSYFETCHQHHIEVKSSFSSLDTWEAMPVLLKASPVKLGSLPVNLHTSNNVRHFFYRNMQVHGKMHLYFWENTRKGKGDCWQLGPELNTSKGMDEHGERREWERRRGNTGNWDWEGRVRKGSWSKIKWLR